MADSSDIQARKLADELISHANNIADQDQSTNDTIGTFRVPPDIRKVKVAQVMTLLDREYVLFLSEQAVFSID